jgi:hypothetical protein
MSDRDITPKETPIPRRYTSKRCSDHSALVVQIEGLREAMRMETEQRERAFTVLSTKLDNTTTEVSKLKVDMAKLLGGIAAALAVIQIVLKFIPSGG